MRPFLIILCQFSILDPLMVNEEQEQIKVIYPIVKLTYIYIQVNEKVSKI